MYMCVSSYGEGAPGPSLLYNVIIINISFADSNILHVLPRCALSSDRYVAAVGNQCYFCFCNW